MKKVKMIALVAVFAIFASACQIVTDLDTTGTLSPGPDVSNVNVLNGSAAYVDIDVQATDCANNEASGTVTIDDLSFDVDGVYCNNSEIGTADVMDWVLGDPVDTVTGGWWVSTDENGDTDYTLLVIKYPEDDATYPGQTILQVTQQVTEVTDVCDRNLFAVTPTSATLNVAEPIEPETADTAVEYTFQEVETTAVTYTVSVDPGMTTEIEPIEIEPVEQECSQYVYVGFYTEGITTDTLLATIEQGVDDGDITQWRARQLAREIKRIDHLAAHGCEKWADWLLTRMIRRIDHRSGDFFEGLSDQLGAWIPGQA